MNEAVAGNRTSDPRIRRLVGILLLTACALGVFACGPHMTSPAEPSLDVKTRTATWPNGQLRARESYVSDSEWGATFRPTLHGVCTYWNEKGEVVAEGTWHNGKPMDGVCWIPAAGDAGSWGGLGHFERYKEGKPLGRMPGSP